MLDFFFNPRSVAVVGASKEEGKLGHGLLNNVIKYGFKGDIYPINPKADEILGLKAYPTVLDVPGPIDLAVIVVPAPFVNGVLEQCGQKGVKGAIVITAGFRETGPEGAKLERELTRTINKYGMRMIGPNCLGIIDTTSSLNASFAQGMAEPGKIAFTSQSGALCTAILDWSKGEGVGFSHFVSIGNKADVEEMDLLQAWRDDPNTSVVIIYLEAISHGQRFMEIARGVTAKKPVIVFKSGTTSAGSRAASSHTGSLAGSDNAYEAAFRQSGIVRARTLQQLFDFSSAFAYQPAIKGNRIAIITNAGGPGIIATDLAEKAGLAMPGLKPETVEYLRANLPPTASVYNPVDIIGDARADRYRVALSAVLKDDNIDGAIVLLVPTLQILDNIDEAARIVVEEAKGVSKPVLTSFMGDEAVAGAVRILNENKIPNYRYPERAVEAMQAMLNYRHWLDRPPRLIEEVPVNREQALDVFRKAYQEGRRNLSEIESREVISAYGIALPKLQLAKTAEEAMTLADSMGYPVVMKIASPDILHKTDIGGVKVGLQDAGEVRDAFDLISFRARRYMPEADIWGVTVQEMAPKGREVIVGMTRDPQFGPLILFGLGGVYVEAIKDVAFRVAPMSRLEAQEMVTEIRSYPLLKGVRGEPPADMKAVVDNILRISQLVTDFPYLLELDINPLFVYPEGRGAIAVDARMILDLEAMATAVEITQVASLA